MTSALSNHGCDSLEALNFVAEEKHRSFANAEFTEHKPTFRGHRFQQRCHGNLRKIFAAKSLLRF
jgi:hypothetical protein